MNFKRQTSDIDSSRFSHPAICPLATSLKRLVRELVGTFHLDDSTSRQCSAPLRVVPVGRSAGIELSEILEQNIAPEHDEQAARACSLFKCHNIFEPK